MTVPGTQSGQLRCFHCGAWMGESSRTLTFMGMFQSPPDRRLVPEPRDTYRCKSCGWANVFRAVMPAKYREMELKNTG